MVGLAIIRVGTGDPPRVLAHGIEGVIPAWSPRGDWIAYRTARRHTARQPGWCAPACPDRQQHVAGSVRYEWDTAFVWSHDGGSLYSIRRTSDRSCSWSRSTPRPGPSASSARWGRTSISARRPTPACASRWRRMARASSRRSCGHARTCGSSKTSRTAWESSTGSAGDNHRTERIELYRALIIHPPIRGQRLPPCAALSTRRS